MTLFFFIYFFRHVLQHRESRRKMFATFCADKTKGIIVNATTTKTQNQIQETIIILKGKTKNQSHRTEKITKRVLANRQKNTQKKKPIYIFYFVYAIFQAWRSL